MSGREPEFRYILDILKCLGCPVNGDSLILDFGCGEGRLVHAMRRAGYRAFGFDVRDRTEGMAARCREEGLTPAESPLFATSTLEGYHIDWPDNHFDAVVSTEVLEHVQNWDSMLCEIHRVLKPGGGSLHLLPARLRPLESHVKVPFGGAFHPYWFLALWALLGFRSSDRRGLPWHQAAVLDHDYLTQNTNYLTRSQMAKRVLSEFGNVQFIETVYVQLAPSRARLLAFPARWCPLVGMAFGTLNRTALFFRKAQECRLETEKS